MFFFKLLFLPIRFLWWFVASIVDPGTERKLW